MALLNKGRLSVQRVDKDAWDAVNKIAKDGDGGLVFKGAKRGKAAKSSSRNEGLQDTIEDDGEEEDGLTTKGKGNPKRKVMAATVEAEGARKSKRFKK